MRYIFALLCLAFFSCAPSSPSSPSSSTETTDTAATDSTATTATDTATDTSVADTAASTAPAPAAVKRYRIPLPAGEVPVHVEMTAEGFYILSKRPAASGSDLYYYRCFNGDGVVTLEVDFNAP